ncbi:MAG: NTP transferase domain-containing protein [Planctomycetaceae bacterium]|nr:NTP transferase domain-containing protein [Planctomycetaceae bacterium]MBV8313800.1 NTP transferase domain-containing protein [Planctomycetaceae bacterium]MBV8607490.1 NTP transferase domain-containing protein [Singulisphaera sp.]
MAPWRPVKAILLAAGLGTRPRPLTNTIPKCLVPIGGRPLLDYWIDRLVEAGVREARLNTHLQHREGGHGDGPCTHPYGQVGRARGGPTPWGPAARRDTGRFAGPAPMAWPGGRRDCELADRSTRLGCRATA